MTGPVPKPSYLLAEVKLLIQQNKIRINPNSLQTAYDDFGWRFPEIKKCLLRLNDKYHLDNRNENHFYKTEPHYFVPNTMMDYYRAVDIMEGFNVYTHFYVHPNFGNLIVSSFRELDLHELRAL
jgi:uncharacterized protein YxjI